MNWTQETSKKKRKRNEKYEENKSFLRSFYDDSSSLRQQLWIRVENRWSHPLPWISWLLRFLVFWPMLLLVGQFSVSPEIKVMNWNLSTHFYGLSTISQLWIRGEDPWSFPLPWISWLLRFPIFWSVYATTGRTVSVNPKIEGERNEILAPIFSRHVPGGRGLLWRVIYACSLFQENQELPWMMKFCTYLSCPKTRSNWIPCNRLISVIQVCYRNPNMSNGHVHNGCMSIMVKCGSAL